MGARKAGKGIEPIHRQPVFARGQAELTCNWSEPLADPPRHVGGTQGAGEFLAGKVSGPALSSSPCFNLDANSNILTGWRKPEQAPEKAWEHAHGLFHRRPAAKSYAGVRRVHVADCLGQGYEPLL
jgi:hypothetical protein